MVGNPEQYTLRFVTDILKSTDYKQASKNIEVTLCKISHKSGPRPVFLNHREKFLQSGLQFVGHACALNLSGSRRCCLQRHAPRQAIISRLGPFRIWSKLYRFANSFRMRLSRIKLTVHSTHLTPTTIFTFNAHITAATVSYLRNKGRNKGDVTLETKGTLPFTRKQRGRYPLPVSIHFKQRGRYPLPASVHLIYNVFGLPCGL